MPQLEYFLVAESLSVDQSTNRVSLFNILEEVGIASEPPPSVLPGTIPGGIPQLVAVSSWNLAPAEANREYRVSLRITQAGQPAKDFGPITFSTDRNRQRVMQG